MFPPVCRSGIISTTKALCVPLDADHEQHVTHARGRLLARRLGALGGPARRLGASILDPAGRLYRWLVAGSVLELLIAVPSHIIVNRRHDCTAPFVSSFGVATGLAMLLMSIGPGALFLYRARMRRIGAARRAGAGPHEPGSTSSP